MKNVRDGTTKFRRRRSHRYHAVLPQMGWELTIDVTYDSTIVFGKNGANEIGKIGASPVGVVKKKKLESSSSSCLPEQ